MQGIRHGSGAAEYHYHKLRNNDAVTICTGRFRGFYNDEHIGDTIVGPRVLTVNIGELVRRWAG